jgi:uncharacterized protein YrrD
MGKEEKKEEKKREKRKTKRKEKKKGKNLTSTNNQCIAKVQSIYFLRIQVKLRDFSSTKYLFFKTLGKYSKY